MSAVKTTQRIRATEHVDKKRRLFEPVALESLIDLWEPDLDLYDGLDDTQQSVSSGSQYADGLGVISHLSGRAVGHNEFVHIDAGITTMVVSMRSCDVRRYRIFGDGCIVAQFGIVGGGVDDVPGIGDFVRREAACTIESVPKGIDIFRVVEKDVQFDSVTVVYRPSALQRFLNFDGAALPTDIHWLLDESISGFNWLQSPLTVEMLRAVQALSCNPFEDELRRQYICAKTKELMCLALSTMKRKCEEEHSSKGLPHREFERLKSARRILEDELMNPPRVDELARRVGTNRSTLIKGFKQAFGVSISNFLRSRRMELAWQLLQEQELPVGLVARQSGYSDFASFSRAFRTWYGVCPKELHASGGRLRQ